MKLEGSASGSASESGSISQRDGSADPDPDPHQNVMDPQHWEKVREMKKCTEDGYTCANLLTQRCTWRQLAMRSNLNLLRL